MVRYRILEKEIDRLVATAIREALFPGVEIFFAQGESVVYHECFGRYDSNGTALERCSVFDLASLTKPIATSAAILHLIDAQKLSLRSSLTEVVPEFFRREKERITLFHLLTHTSGLPAWRDLYSPRFDRRQGWAKLCDTELDCPPGQKVVYSCLGFLVLSEIVRRVSGSSLADYCREHIFGPIRTKRLCFRPGKSCRKIVPTAFCPIRNRYLRGSVHDENAYLFDEEGGNAGLFGTVGDIHRFCRMVFGEGTLEGETVLSREAVRYWTESRLPEHLSQRALGWDVNGRHEEYRSCGEKMPIGSLGHTGFTGTSLWMDKRTELVAIILSNRVNISREGNLAGMRAFRPQIHDLLLSMV